MKQLIFVFILSLVIYSCNSGSATSKEKFIPGSDTVKLWGTYVDFPSKDIKAGITFRIITKTIVPDSSLTITSDSLLSVKKVYDTAIWILPSQDTTYKRTINGSVAYDLNVDSSIAKVSRWINANENVFIKDTTKKQ